ncbi:uncharacterized protein LOC108672492 [Hyalella azteca]|uniref:Uncharacterized protein LOC108672492 n=1 Tax=Hyalella azteca TaxID=294128 RepID=A0A8B7NPP1_HYAAZ|nr:uncharacterized protein LOC108672492 [Hyalella azteca]
MVKGGRRRSNADKTPQGKIKKAEDAAYATKDDSENINLRQEHTESPKFNVLKESNPPEARIMSPGRGKKQLTADALAMTAATTDLDLLGRTCEINIYARNDNGIHAEVAANGHPPEEDASFVDAAEKDAASVDAAEKDAASVDAAEKDAPSVDAAEKDAPSTVANVEKPTVITAAKKISYVNYVPRKWSTESGFSTDDFGDPVIADGKKNTSPERKEKIRGGPKMLPNNNLLSSLMTFTDDCGKTKMQLFYEREKRNLNNRIHPVIDSTSKMRNFCSSCGSKSGWYSQQNIQDDLLSTPDHIRNLSLTEDLEPQIRSKMIDLYQQHALVSAFLPKIVLNHLSKNVAHSGEVGVEELAQLHKLSKALSYVVDVIRSVTSEDGLQMWWRCFSPKRKLEVLDQTSAELDNDGAGPYDIGPEEPQRLYLSESKYYYGHPDENEIVDTSGSRYEGLCSDDEDRTLNVKLKVRFDDARAVAHTYT